MHGSAISALFFLLSLSTFAVGQAASNQISAPSDHDLVLQHQNNENITVNFQAACLACRNGSLPLELSVRVASNACEGTGVFLNGDELIHSWTESFGHGFGIIVPFSNDIGATTISASWQSICIPAAPQSSERHATQLLTVHINRVGDMDFEDDVGFTASFKQVGRPEILQLCTTPGNFSINESSIDNWEDPETSDHLEYQPNPDNTEEYQPQEDLEWHWEKLQSLRAKEVDLDRQIEQEENNIRKILQQDCSRTSTQWKYCRSFGCRVRVSFLKVPDLIRQIRYRFGPFPSSLPDSCLERTQCGHCTTNSDSSTYQEISDSQIHTPEYIHSWETPKEGSYEPTTIPVSSIPEHADPGQKVDSPHDHEVIVFFRVCAVAILVGTILALVIKICRSTAYCRRRRADRAACREERRTRRAYRSAARRLRWRQWWEGRTHGLFTTTPTDHDLPLQIQHPDIESNPLPEPGPIQAEIMDFMQTLEYVGELVGKPTGDLEGAYSPQRDTDPEIAEAINRRRRMTVNSAPSSTAVLSTVVSLRTNSLMSLDTGSYVTLDTLGTMDPPPDYDG